ncbi:unnamed protein product [Prunus armeniaca]
MVLKVDPARQRLVAQHDSTGRLSSKNFSPSAGSRPAGSTPSSLDGPPKCCHCNGNHYSENSSALRSMVIPIDETRHSAPSANLCASDTMPSMGSNTWIIGTGASDHMTYNDNMFDQLSRNPRDLYITNANGLPSPVTSEGTIHLTPSLPLSHALLDLKTHAKIGHGKQIGGVVLLTVTDCSSSCVCR